MRKITVFVFFISSIVLADPAEVITEGALLYSEPDFDSEVIGDIEAGVKVEVSKRKFGPFHRARMKDGTIGYIADNDIEVAGKKRIQPSGIFDEKKEAEQVGEPEVPLSLNRFLGLSWTMLRYREETMGQIPTRNTNFLGVKFTGPNVLMKGFAHSEVNVLLHTGAPEYYAEMTGVDTSGLLLITNMLFQTIYPRGDSRNAFIGVGPMIRYSRYTVGLRSGPTTTYYSPEDLTMGLSFHAGLTVSVAKGAGRIEYIYNWEKQQYWGLGLSALFPF